MDTQNSLEKKYPVFYKTCIHLQKSFFYKDIFNANEHIPVNYPLAEKICADVLLLSHNNWDDYVKKVDRLIDINMEFLKLQAHLERDGKYLYSSFEEVEREVFSKKDENDESGVKYLWGLYFTQIFWVTHHRLFNFFINEFVGGCREGGACLEIPVGSGIFLAHFLIHKKNWRGVGIDLSNSAIDITKQLFATNNLNPRTTLLEEDILKYDDSTTYDRIICGELLEHVENPLLILKKLHSLLKKDGKLFLTTVAWAAGIDHIYLYRNADEIREHITLSGFTIEKEFIQNVFPKDKDRVGENNIALNYTAILTKE